MERLQRPTENKGDARGYSGIKKDNKNKYLQEMPEGLRNRIEMLTVDTMTSLGYPVTYAGKKKRLSSLWMTVLQLTDGVHMLTKSLTRPHPRRSFYFLRQYWRITAKLDLFKK